MTETNLHILIVDDDVGAARGLGRLLRTYGHDVQISYTALEGLELAPRIKPDLILHDIAMEPIDGYEAARRLRKMPSLSATLLIACSGSVDERQARAAGFDGWLVKPVSGGELEAVLALVLEGVNRRSAKNGSNSDADAAN